MKRWLGLAALLALLFALPAAARVDFDYDSIDPAVKVHDLAGLLSDGEEARLAEEMQALGDEYETDVAAVTVDENPGTAQQLAEDIFDYCGFGYASGNDGVLLLIDMDNRETAIVTTGTAEHSIRQEQMGAILDEIGPKLTARDYADAVEVFIDCVRYELTCYAAEQNGEPLPPGYEAPYTPVSASGSTANWPVCILVAAGIAAAVTGVRMFLLYRRHRPVQTASEAASYTVPDSFRVTRQEDVFLRSSVTKTRIPKDNGGSSGGSSGGFHTGSSGTSHGGGSRSF